jgi:hypothetical protein
MTRPYEREHYRIQYALEHEWRNLMAATNSHMAELIEYDNLASIEPCRVPTPCTTPILPGSQHAAAAFKQGSEDEYSNRMKAKYGGEW